ncbi:MAG: hypothetical protein MJ180_02740 [Candidatus Gastranaerophilales bacterium]|nr:hypothetical protein [Candidatus Gastranaerophilales bacterium]
MQINSISCNQVLNRQNFRGYLKVEDPHTVDGDLDINTDKITKITQGADNIPTIYYFDSQGDAASVRLYNQDFQTVIAAYTAASQRPIGITIDISKQH